MPSGKPKDAVKSTQLGLVMYKRRPGPEQVSLHVEVDIPGSWFKGLSATERKEKYRAVAVAHEERHVFEAASRGQSAKVAEAIAFLCLCDAMEEADPQQYWIRIDDWNRYRHDTYKDNPTAEDPFLPAAEVVETAPSAEPKKEEEKQKAAVYNYFTFLKDGFHTVNEGKANESKAPCEWYECKNKASGRCKGHEDSYKVVKKATSTLTRHVKHCFGDAAWVECRMASPNSKARQRADGSLIEAYSFKQLLPHHTRFVIFCFRLWDHFSKSRSAEFKDYIIGWNEQAALPHATVAKKLLYVIQSLMRARITALCDASREFMGQPIAGVQDDIWSKKSCRQSYGAMRLSLALDGDMLDTVLPRLRQEQDQKNKTVEKKHKLTAPGFSVPKSYAGTIVEAAPVIAFSPLPSSRHTASILARWKKQSWSAVNCVIDDISLATEDGASNNKKSNKILKLPSKVCDPHNLQRCIQYAMGSAGKPSQNPALDAFLKKSNKMVSSFSRSGVANADLIDAQIADGEKVGMLAAPNHTRWLGTLRQATKNRVKQKYISVALCGQADGMESDDDEEQDLSGYEGGELSDQGAGSGVSGDDEPEAEANSDDDRIERAARSSTSYPLALRLLSNDEFKLNAQFEAVLINPGEVSALLQTHTGVALDDSYVLLSLLREIATGSKVAVAHGPSEDNWMELSANKLDAMFKLLRSILAQQLDERFHISTTPDEHTLLALKMNPSIDTSAQSELFGEKVASRSLMEATYGKHLRIRFLHLEQMAAKSAAAAAASAAATIASGGAATSAHSSQAAPPRRPPSPTSTTASSASKRYKMSSMAASAFARAKAPATSEDMAASQKISQEQVIFDAASQDLSSYYEDGKFNKNRFWIDNRHRLPIHYRVYLGDCASKKAASANVETVFSGATKLAEDATTMGDDVLGAYVACHVNWQFEFLRPAIHDVVCTYLEIHGAVDEDSLAEAAAALEKADAEAEDQDAEAMEVSE